MTETLYCDDCGGSWIRTVVRGPKPRLCRRCKEWQRPAPARTRKVKPSNLILSDGGKKEAGFAAEKNDCTVRVVALACGVDYKTAYTFMANNGRKSNKGSWFHKVIAYNNYNILGKQVKPETVFAAKGLKTFLLRNPKLRRGTWVLHSTQHVSVLAEGVLLDSFDSSRKTFEGAWRVLDGA